MTDETLVEKLGSLADELDEFLGWMVEFAAKRGIDTSHFKGRTHYEHSPTIREAANRITSLEEEKRVLREVLTEARAAIASLDEYALGGVEVANVYTGEADGQYPIRDELLSNIDTALSAGVRQNDV